MDSLVNRKDSVVASNQTSWQASRDSGYDIGRQRWPNTFNAIRRRHSLNLQKTQLDYSLLHHYAGEIDVIA
jgi:hypothetical protein